MYYHDLIQVAHETKKLSALIIDESQSDTEALTEKIQSFFNSITTNDNLTDALKDYQKNPYDVIFIDFVDYPEELLDFIKALRDINPYQIIHIISKNIELKLITNIVELNVDSFYQKPISKTDVIDILQKILITTKKNKKAQTKIFSISLPLDLYEKVDQIAKEESISKNSVIIRAIKNIFSE